MKTLCALALWLSLALPAGVAKEKHCQFRVHAQANPRDTTIFATSVHAQLSGKDVAIEKMPRMSELDVIAFYPYPAKNGTYGALFQLDEHGRIARISDGKIYIASGLTAADIESMKKDWRLIGKSKR